MAKKQQAHKKHDKKKKSFDNRTLKNINAKGSLIGIDIGSGYVKMVKMKHGKMMKAVSEKMPEGVVADSRVETPSVLIKIIKNMKRKHHFSSKRCAVCLSGNEVIMREIKLPMMKEQQIMENIKQELSNIYLLSTEDFVIDYKVLHVATIEQDGEDSIQLMVVAIAKNYIKDILRMLRKSKFKAEYIDVYPNVIAKIVKKIKDEREDEPEDICVIDFGTTLSHIAFIKNGKYMLHKNVKNGGSYVTELIANHMNLDKVMAENYKINNSTLVEENAISEYLYDYFDSLISEIDNSLYYFRNMNNQKIVDRIYITGGSSRLVGLKEYLQRQLGIEVMYLSERFIVNKNKRYRQINTEEYTNSIGVSIREEWIRV